MFLKTLRNIIAAFHKSNVLAQTNQKKYDCFFLYGTESIKKLFSQDLKLKTKIPDTFL